MSKIIVFLSTVYQDHGWTAVGILIVILVLSMIALDQFLGIDLIELLEQLGG